MKLHRSDRRYLSFLLVLLAGMAGCDDDNDPITPEPVNEAAVLVDYLEANRGYDVHGGFITTAENVRTTLVAEPDAQHIIDIRAADAYASGHIPGAVNVAVGDLIDYMAGLSPAATTYDDVVIVCYSGQTAAYVTGVLRALGYENVVSMKWGMSAWNEAFASPWMGGHGNGYAVEFETGASPAKNPAGALPELSTGFEDPARILQARAEEAITGFGEAKVGASTVFANLDTYYVVNFWPQATYETVGHIPGAIDYDPAGAPFTTATDLLTLPTDRPVVLYCYTGQTSAYLAGYLRVLGYDARTLLYGVNGMAYDRMTGGKWADTEIKGYDFES